MKTSPRATACPTLRRCDSCCSVSAARPPHPVPTSSGTAVTPRASLCSPTGQTRRRSSSTPAPGLRDLTQHLGGQPYRGSILVTHLHWDHVQGLPFFVAGDRDDAQVNLYVPAQNSRTGRDLLAAAMAPPNFPITPEGLKGAWTFSALDSGYHTVGGFRVRATEVRHKGGRTFGYRISDDSSSIAYVPDHVISPAVGDEVRDLIHDVDVLLHDAQFVESERALADALRPLDRRRRRRARAGVRRPQARAVPPRTGPHRRRPRRASRRVRGIRVPWSSRSQGDVIDVASSPEPSHRSAAAGRRTARAERGRPAVPTRPCGRAGGTRAGRRPSTTA